MKRNHGPQILYRRFQFSRVFYWLTVLATGRGEMNTYRKGYSH